MASLNLNRFGVDGVRRWYTRHGASRAMYLLFLGQLASFVLALVIFFSSLIAELGVDAPLTQISFSYLSLAVVYGSIMLYRRQKLKVSWYWYLLLGFIDVQGNYLVNKSFQFTSITSATLLDCFVIVWVIILTWALLGTRYTLCKLLGAAVCVGGLGLVLLSDAGVGGGGGSKPLLGDALVLMGTVFIALSNVAEEFCVKKKDLVEVVSMLGLFGLFVTLVEIAIAERKSLVSIEWSEEIILAFVGFTLSNLMFYSIVPFVLKMGGATLFNLSALTSDMWAVVFRILFYHQQVDWLYYLAFVVVAVGLVVYLTSEEDPDSLPTAENGNLGADVEDAEYQVLNGEEHETSKVVS